MYSKKSAQKQQWDLALKECRDILNINPKETLAYVRMGSIFYALGLKTNAFAAWKYAEKLSPNDPNVIKAVQFMEQQPKSKSSGGEKP